MELLFKMKWSNNERTVDGVAHLGDGALNVGNHFGHGELHTARAAEKETGDQRGAAHRQAMTVHTGALHQLQ